METFMATLAAFYASLEKVGLITRYADLKQYILPSLSHDITR